MPMTAAGVYLPESYLIYGFPSSGKTETILAWAELHPEAKVYVLDADNKFRRVWLAKYPHLKNIVHYGVTNWQDVLGAFDAVKKELEAMPMAQREQQCIALESVDKFWDWSQQDYLLKFKGMTRAEYLQALKKEADPEKLGISDKDSQTYWRLVKDSHNTDVLDYIVDQLRCNLIMTSPAMPLSTVTNKGKPQESNEVLELYGGFGYKPEGEKRNGYRVETIILLEYNPKDKSRRWSSVKDKDKPGATPIPEAFRREFTGSFWIDYMTFTGAPV